MTAQPDPSLREKVACVCVTSGNGEEGCGLCNETGLRAILSSPDAAPDEVG